MLLQVWPDAFFLKAVVMVSAGEYRKMVQKRHDVYQTQFDQTIEAWCNIYDKKDYQDKC